jgi:mutator protein MutT
LLPTVAELDGWRYCPRCRAELSRDDDKIDCPDCGFVAYGGSKPTASAVVLDEEERVLLSRRAVDPFAGKWDLPGGFLEEGEHPVDCVRRELQEEAGVEIEPLVFLGIWIDGYVYRDRSFSTLNLYWTARIVAGEPVPRDDVAELRWFAPHEVPADELAFGHLPAVLSALRDQHA